MVMNLRTVELAARLARVHTENHPDLVADHAVTLAKAGRAATKAAERECNEPNPRPMSRKLRAEAELVAAQYKLRCEWSNHPHGYCLRLVGLSGALGLGGSDGFGVG